jgi:DNA-binding transcriptional LysR family regulator
MELRHLRYFRTVAELLNFSRAAERLRVAQPALSRQIRDLEQELEVRLFDRNRVRVSLTDAGRTFHAHTCKILAQVDIAVAAVAETKTGVSGELVICNDWRLSNPIVLGAIAEFRAQYPRVDVALHDLHSHEQLTALRTRRAHLGFVVGGELAAHDELESLSLLTSAIMVMVGARHRLAGRSGVRIAELAHETWMTMEAREAPGYREFVTQICRLSGFTPGFGLTEHSAEGLIARVATGYGVCLLPEFLIDRVNSLVRYLRSDCQPIELRAVWHRREESQLLRQFLDILRRHIVVTTQPVPV